MYLKELEDHGTVTKKIYQQLLPKVVYTLTEIGWSFVPAIDAMNQWGDSKLFFFRKYD